MRLPLKGLNVVSIEQAVAAPLCTHRLVLAGAQVFKIERPEGDFARGYDTAVEGESAYFVWLNGGKKSVVLDLRGADEVARLQRLIAHCDVFVQNLKPNALAKLGIDLNALHKLHPKLISMSITGFHPSGPGAQRKAYDLLMQAESGLADITGSPDAAGRVGVSLVDMATGNFAYEAILEALLVRAASGQGEALNVSLFDSVAEWMAVPYLLQQHTGQAPARVGLAHPGICPYGVFTAADGKQFVLSIQNEREWQRLCEIGLQHTDLLVDPRCISNETRVAHRDFVDGEVQRVFAQQNYAQISVALDRADVAFAPLNGVGELATHADFRTQLIKVAGREVRLPTVPGRPKPENLAVPRLGEHTEEVLEWLENLDR